MKNFEKKVSLILFYLSDFEKKRDRMYYGGPFYEISLPATGAVRSLTIRTDPKDLEGYKPLKLDPGKKYQITGTRKTHTMKPGDYLAKIAFEEYGDKEFARYIINHNRFPNPDNIPVGKEINLPELKEIE